MVRPTPLTLLQKDVERFYGTIQKKYREVMELMEQKNEVSGHT